MAGSCWAIFLNKISLAHVEQEIAGSYWTRDRWLVLNNWSPALVQLTGSCRANNHCMVCVDREITGSQWIRDHSMASVEQDITDSYWSRYHWLVLNKMQLALVNPLSPHNALKHHFTSLKTDLIFPQPGVLERKFPRKWFTNTWQFHYPLQIIFIHYKSKIATAIRGL